MTGPPKQASIFNGDEIIAYTDGASRGNPGPAGYGVVIQDAQGNRVENLSEFVGEATNNVAEYRALLAALEYALGKQARRLKVYCDSELVARQMQGRYRVQSPDLRPLYERARRLASQIGEFSIESLPREQNHEADLLANQALDQAMGRATNRRTPAPAPTVQVFNAIVEGGKLRPLEPSLELEEGVEYEVRASRRLPQPGQNR